MNGCLFAFFALMTLGTVPLLLRMGEWHFIRRMDDAGLETRGGRRIAWSDVTGIRRVIGTMNGAQIANEIIVRASRRKASLMLSRCINGAEAEAYLLGHVPPNVGAG
jgi:hypothetical protein